MVAGKESERGDGDCAVELPYSDIGSFVLFML